MRDTWIYKYGKHIIKVKNEATSSFLYVDDILQDKCLDLFSAKLSGKLPEGEEIKASLGGMFTIGCALFVNNIEQTPEE